ncbi:MAG TPA: M15 family metallopeptidase [Dokdonella sp.]|nr:M15 family metallopeptidase [Dokdonella sp.]HET9032490.1 M15 family metallopeptidase [Dokdonella sp.]
MVCFGLQSGQAASDAKPVLSSATTAAEADLVDITSLVPDITLDMRYAGADNFVGAPIDGYGAARCLLKSRVARALADVERNLRKRAMRLQVFDCYRPVRAVNRFVEWATDPGDQKTKAQHYPNLDKSELLGDYIAPVSGHSRGATIDLTLKKCDDRGTHCRTLDMGTDFDFFDPRAHTDSTRVSNAQRANRQRLRAAMQAGGFKNYPMEWWHYRFETEPSPETIYDVPIEKRP